MGTDAHDPDPVRDLLTPQPEQPFGCRFWVDVTSFGHPTHHGPKLRDRIFRELELAFGKGKVFVSQVEESSWDQELQLGATPNSGGLESSATSGSSPNGAQSAEESD